MSDLSRNAGIVVILLAVSVAFGAWATMQDPAVGEQLISLLKESIMGEALDSSGAMMAVMLFFNNLQACVLMFIGGASLGLLTVFIISTNGFVIGSVLEMVREEHSALYVAAAIIPHGIFEIPAFVVSGALGLMLAKALWKEWEGSEDAASRALAYARTFLLAVVPLVAVAACVEAFITPEILRLAI
ncbi:MAG TPA: stage II sporulation protein M [Methanolinea sp.]|jgi:stage II sporulation protein M|nr:stage II sporulation protein M [Methanolinea sp.]